MTDDSRKYNPLAADHPLIRDECFACKKPFKEGDITTLVSLGPADDEEAQQKCREGKYYTAVAIPIHWACHTGHQS